jgi:hypothetical protein
MPTFTHTPSLSSQSWTPIHKRLLGLTGPLQEVRETVYENRLSSVILSDTARDQTMCLNYSLRALARI